MITVREALELVLKELPLLESEAVALSEAANRVLAEDVRSDRDVPPFRNSAMDGYAVRAADTAGTGRSPVTLDVLEVIGAGEIPVRDIRPGTAIQIMTGAVLPEGADAVVKVEDTEAAAGDTVSIHRQVSPDENVRPAGDDIRQGELVLEGGRQLRPADVGLLASLGRAQVRVRKQPTVAVLATGDELIDVGDAVAPGKIVNSNAYTLAAAVRQAGGIPRMFGIVRDTPEALRQAFAEALKADVVLSTGGVSMGVYDLVRQTLASLGVEERFWKVAQKPGKPLTFGLRDGTPVFGLPGNPVSSLVCFYVYVRPALKAMLGLEEIHLPVIEAVAGENISVAKGLTEFVRCSLSGLPGEQVARVTGSQSSGVLRSMSLGDALLISPPGTGVIECGAAVRVLLLAHNESRERPV
jgi:molybdopterin molybdotransferase